MDKIDSLTNFLISEEENETSLVIKDKQNHLIKKNENSQIVIADGRKYELLPKTELPPTAEVKRRNGEYNEDKDYVYWLYPNSSNLMLKETSMTLPEDMSNLSPEERNLMIANYLATLEPIKEKKLKIETMPSPLKRAIFVNLISALVAIGGAFVGIWAGFLTWHIFIFAGIAAVYYLWMAGLTYYLAHTRNFKVFSGIVTNVTQKMPFVKSLKKTYVQVSNGKKFLTFPYNVKKRRYIPVGTPVTVFIPSAAEVIEGPMGPTIEFPLAISFSLDVKASDKHGEYKDGRMKDQTSHEFFND